MYTCVSVCAHVWWGVGACSRVKTFRRGRHLSDPVLPAYVGCQTCCIGTWVQTLVLTVAQQQRQPISPSPM